MSRRASSSDTSRRSCSAPGGGTPTSSACSSARSAAARSCRGQVDELGQAFTSIERIVVHGQQEGAFRSDLDARLLSWIFYGAIEEILTGWVLGRLPDGDDDVATAERTVIEVVCAGIAA